MHDLDTAWPPPPLATSVLPPPRLETPTPLRTPELRDAIASIAGEPNWPSPQTVSVRLDEVEVDRRSPATRADLVRFAVGVAGWMAVISMIWLALWVAVGRLERRTVTNMLAYSHMVTGKIHV